MQPFQQNPDPREAASRLDRIAGLLASEVEAVAAAIDATEVAPAGDGLRLRRFAATLREQFRA